MDVVCEGADIRVIAVVILHSYLYLAGILHISGAQINYLVMYRSISLFLMDIIDEFSYTSLIEESFILDMLGISLVLQLDVHARVQERLLSESSRESIIVVNVGVLEYLGVCLEGDLRTTDFGLSDLLEVAHDLAALITLIVDILAVAYSDLEPLRQSVYYRRAHAVQTARYLISAAAELTAGVQYGEYHRHSGQTHLRVDAHGYAASVILYPDDITGQDAYIYLIAVAGQSLVYRVVHYLIYEMMQTSLACRAYVHTGALTHGLKSLKDLYLVRAVVALYLSHLFVIRNIHCLDICFGSIHELLNYLFDRADLIFVLIQFNSSVSDKVIARVRHACQPVAISTL